MKYRIIFGVFLLIILILGSCVRGHFVSLYYTYSPLTGYENKGLKVTNMFPFNGPLDNNYSIFNFYKKTTFASENGLVSNTNYVCLSGKDILHFVRDGSNIVTNLIYHFGSTNGVSKVSANEKYVAFVSNNILNVILTNTQSVWKQTVNPTNGLLAMGNGTSPLLAFGEIKDGSSGYGNHDLYVIDLSTSNTNIMTNIQDIVGFSRANKYLFLTYFWDVSANTSLDPNTDYYNYAGVLAYYDINKNKLQLVGDLPSCTPYTIPDVFIGNDYKWTNWPIGVSEDFRYFYLYENGNMSIFSKIYHGDITNYQLYDGRSIKDIYGIWRIDISSLGLSE